MELERTAPEVTPRFYGKYRGTVYKNDDPKKLGRIRAKVPEVLGSVASGWAWPCVAISGDEFGMFTVPPEKAGVWIEFEAGKVWKPIWTGCWWPSGKLPKDQAGNAATPDVKILRSEKGLLVSLNDADQTIAVSDGNGKNLLHIDAQAGEIVVTAQTKVTLDVPQIELVKSASHALVFGDSLLQYLQNIVQTFNMHTHPGQMAGSIPVTPQMPASPMTTPSSSLLSTKVKTG